MNSRTTVVPTFYHGQSRSQDQGIFFIHCHHDVILAAGVQANSLLPATETFDHEATVPTYVVQNI